MGTQSFLRRCIRQAPIAIAVLGLSALIFAGLILAQEPSELIGQVKLQSRTNHSGVRILVNGELLGTTMPDGTWRITYTISGPHQVEIAMPGFLSVKAIIKPVTGGEVVVYDARSVQLEAGDVNGDGQIDIFDLVQIVRAAQDPRLSSDPVLDLNGDNRVDIREVTIISANIGHKTSTFSLTPRTKHVRATPTIGSRGLVSVLKWLSWRAQVLLSVLLTISSTMIILGPSIMRTRSALKDIRSKDPEKEMLNWVQSVQRLEGALAELSIPDLSMEELLKELEEVRTRRRRLKRFKE